VSRRLAFLLFFVVLGIVPAIRSLAGTVSVTFSMPQGVDPPVSKFLNTGSVGATSSELAPTVGVELHGRSLEVVNSSTGCQVFYKDITAVRIQFVYSGNVKVQSGVGQGFQNFKPWSAQTSFDRSTSTWTIILTAQPGSALLSDWDLTGGALQQGFFAALTAGQGNNAAPITNVSITPLNSALNSYQRSSKDVTDSTPPAIDAAVSPTTLWSPDNKPVVVTLTTALQDALVENVNNYISGLDPCSVTLSVAQVDGDVTTPLGDFPFTLTDTGGGSFGLTAQLSLQATRDGFNVAGRLYNITISATDNAGNLAQTTVTVTVAHDNSGP
jgi:hypothetical protein